MNLLLILVLTGVALALLCLAVQRARRDIAETLLRHQL